MVRLLPFIIAALAILVLTFVEGSITDRWVNVNQESAYCATLLDEIPEEFGDWEGKDQEVDGLIQKVAGAQGYVSRIYQNKVTGHHVKVWLIVGHARDTAEHTPDSCYPGQGFSQKEKNKTYAIDVAGEEPATFFTAVFSKSSNLGQFSERVFWAWFKPSKEAASTEGAGVKWIAPENPRFFFGSTRALYKLYFTTSSPSPDEDPKDSLCLEFAEEFLPIANTILAKANGGAPEDFKSSQPEDSGNKEKEEDAS